MFKTVFIFALLISVFFCSSQNVSRCLVHIQSPHYLEIPKENGDTTIFNMPEYADIQTDKAIYLKKHNITERGFSVALENYFQFERFRLADSIAEVNGVKNYKIINWGAAASSCGISGFIGEDRVIWHAGKLYKGKERPPGWYAKCLPPYTLISTPQGKRYIKELQVGDQVFTMNRMGEKISALVVNKNAEDVPPNHQLISMVLADGRHLKASPGHPAADYTPLGQKEIGDTLDGSKIVVIEAIEYLGLETQDLLPAGETGLYWANDILVGSTLAPESCETTANFKPPVYDN